ncbi:glutamine-hydrolyzing GMP synthase [Candidatus Woesearchaeota archaeon]|nr:glutamine-hydrolyzing GMP synthase [Candidatus Woesearchaeota archaeon]
MITVIDFGGQYAHLIARRIRQLGVYAEIKEPTIKAEEIRKTETEGIILSGGPKSVYEKNAFTIDKKLLELGVPVLGICYGHQLIAHLLGGKVVSANKEYGKETLQTGKSELLKGLASREQVWASHGDAVIKLPEGFKTTGSTQECKIAAYENPAKKIYGVQFHPEVQHTTNGMTILQNFVNICGSKRTYSMKGLDKRLIAEIKKQVGRHATIMGVSGGVDSLVASVLIRKATPNIHCVFVDTGLLRKGEKEEVAQLYKELGFEHFTTIDARGLFLSRLKGVTEPEEKRKIIGKAFVEVFEKKVEELKGKHDIRFLGQGTIYPDRIESAKSSGQAAVIKTHHNVGGLPEKMKLLLIEPLKELYKDEVRELGRILGIEKEHLNRHPFPGPGLAVRILREITPEKIKILQEADFIFTEELKKSGYYEKTWQAFAALLDSKAVGVMGDARAYGYIIALRAVTSLDAMTADWARLPNELLEKTANRITKKVKGATRVLYDITQKPPATIEYE